ncbi:hypothetical protein [Maribacter halichondriae]|uniref:hypothetical protein n=1 Tax=Maribacter halichondriae TaxID=2980554 RepID=UPI002358CD3E|nr:hypothetical protein [Maribacter sp. Hal144]
MTAVKKILKTPLRISIAVLLVGMTAKIMQWPFAKEIMLISFVAIGILYTARFWKKSEKQYVDYVKLILVMFWTTNGILRILDFPYTLFFQIVTAITFVIWFVMEGTAYFMDEDRRAKNTLSHILWNCTLVAGTLGIICGSLLKILYWEYATHLLSLGITMVAAYILKDIFLPSSTEDEEGNNEEFQL